MGALLGYSSTDEAARPADLKACLRDSSTRHGSVVQQLYPARPAGGLGAVPAASGAATAAGPSGAPDRGAGACAPLGARGHAA